MISSSVQYSGKKRNMRAKGFTFIELMITIALLGIMGAIATSSFQRIAINGNLKSATREITSVFAFIKERAISENRMYRILLSTEGSNSYTIQQCDNPGSSCNGWASIQLKTLTGFGDDISFAPKPHTTVLDYRFQTRGTVTNGTIVLSNQRGSRATIKINFTGRTRAEFVMQ